MLSQLAFVDIETTGLSPSKNRIAEIGAVIVDGDRLERWSVLLKPSSRHPCPESPVADRPPAFADIARELAAKLDGHLVIAHNARFDYSFLRAEFERVGIAFSPKVLCSLMLSRKLHPELEHHDLDSLSEHHGLDMQTRHRALPDADLVWQWWQVVHRQIRVSAIARSIESLLAGPVLPSQLDPSLINRLPDSPGAYVFHDERNRPLVVGAANNLRLHAINYFRIDHATAKAIEYAHRVTHITWHSTRGILGARLRAAELDQALLAKPARQANAPQFTLRLSPGDLPCVAIVPLSEAVRNQTESFGFFPTERKAYNALTGLAMRRRLCHCLLGIAERANVRCLACPIDRNATGCAGRIDRQRQLLRLFVALRSMRVSVWPHRGPIGIREHGDLHIVDRWRYLGTAREESDIHELLQCGQWDFDKRIYRLLSRSLPRVASQKIIDLSDKAGA